MLNFLETFSVGVTRT